MIRQRQRTDRFPALALGAALAMMSNGGSGGCARSQPAAAAPAPAPAKGTDAATSCEAALRLGRAKFIEAYEAKNNDHSENGEDQAALHYAECKEKKNAQALAALPAEQRAQLQRLKEALGRWETSYFSVIDFGGTAANHNANRSTAGREDLMARILAAVTTPSAPAGAHRDPKAELRRLPILTDSAGLGDALPPSDREAFHKEVATLKAATAELEKLLSALPQAAAPALDYLRDHKE